MSQPSNNSFFSERAIYFHRDKSLGDVSMVQPVSIRLLTAFVISIVLIFSLFLYFGEYARKVTVVGYLEPELGILDIFPPTAGGLITNILVEDGQIVTKGDVLLEISYSKVLESGNTAESAQEGELRKQEKLLSDLISNAKLDYQLQQASITNRIASIKGELNELHKLKELQQDRFLIILKQVEASQKLYSQQMISELQFLSMKANEIDYQQKLILSEQRHLELQSELQITEDELLGLPARTNSEKALLYLQQSKNNQAISLLKAQSDLVVIAPKSGRVTSFQVKSGELAKGDVPLFSLIPEDSELKGKLLVPSSAIGFVTRNQRVRLMFDAYPYQQYGVVPATLISISEAPVSPKNISGPIPSNVPVYLAEVKLEENSIAANGMDQRFLPGMLVKADIVLEKRSLIEWITEPIFKLKGRAS